jgi:hypothetical protein
MAWLVPFAHFPGVKILFTTGFNDQGDTAEHGSGKTCAGDTTV